MGRDGTKSEAWAESWPHTSQQQDGPREVEVSHRDLGGEAAAAEFEIPA